MVQGLGIEFRFVVRGLGTEFRFVVQGLGIEFRFRVQSLGLGCCGVRNHCVLCISPIQLPHPIQ